MIFTALIEPEPVQLVTHFLMVAARVGDLLVRQVVSRVNS